MDRTANRLRRKRRGGARLQPRLADRRLLFLAEPKNAFVRFHALQSLIVFGAASVAFVICLSIPFLGWILSFFVFYGSVAVWLLMLFKAYKGERFGLPFVGRMVNERL